MNVVGDSGLIRSSSSRDRLLIVQPLVGIGDMVWHKPWIDYLAATNDVILAAKPTARSKAVFEGTPGIVDWIDIERSLRGRRGVHDGFFGLLRLARAFRKSGADRALILHHSSRYTLAARIAGISRRWGYGIGSSRRWLNAGCFVGSDARFQHPTKKLAEFAHLNGFGIDAPVWKMQASKPGRAHAEAFFKAHKIAGHNNQNKSMGRPMAVMGIGAMDIERRWPPAQFVKLAAMLAREWPDLAIVVMGGPAEAQIIDTIMADPAAPDGLIANTDDLDPAIEILSQAALYVGNDTSLLNIAAACQRPAIGLFAQSPPLDYNPNILAVSLPSGKFGIPRGIETISPEQAFSAVNIILQQQRRTSA
jgi:heptosyltransferase-2